MEYNDIKDQLVSHPTLLILRDRQAALILGYLGQVFNENRMAVLSREDLQLGLAIYLEDLEWPSTDENSDFTRLAGDLLDSWCHEKKRYLRRYTNDQGVIVYELTSYSEKALRWMEDLEPKEFVGAESRFSDIFSRLKDLVEGSQVNPEKRLEQLNEKKAVLNKEIKDLKEQGEFKVYEDWQIRERFEELSRSSRDLLSDFKQVEDNFKGITRRLFESEMNRQMNRGSMLQLTLDASDEMKNTPQGRSFSTFWYFLMADFGKDEINSLVSSVYDLVKEDAELQGDSFLRELKYYLHQAGMKILDTNHKMAEKLNRILSDSQFFERHKIREDILDIKSLILEMKGQVPENPSMMSMNHSAEIILPMERPLSLPREEIIFEEPEFGEREETDLSVLFDPWYIDPKQIRNNISRALKNHSSIRLSEILQKYPPEKGLGEIMAYLEMASHSRSAIIQDNEKQLVEYTINDVKKSLMVPEVVFLNEKA